MYCFLFQPFHRPCAERSALDAFYKEIKEPTRVLDGTNCLLCSKRFGTMEDLDKHCRISKLHKRNLGIMQQGQSEPAEPSIRRAGAGLGVVDAAAPAPLPPRGGGEFSYRDKAYQAAISRFND